MNTQQDQPAKKSRSRRRPDAGPVRNYVYAVPRLYRSDREGQYKDSLDVFDFQSRLRQRYLNDFKRAELKKRRMYQFLLCMLSEGFDIKSKVKEKRSLGQYHALYIACRDASFAVRDAERALTEARAGTGTRKLADDERHLLDALTQAKATLRQAECARKACVSAIKARSCAKAGNDSELASRPVHCTCSPAEARSCYKFYSDRLAEKHHARKKRLLYRYRAQGLSTGTVSTVSRMNFSQGPPPVFRPWQGEGTIAYQLMGNNKDVPGTSEKQYVAFTLDKVTGQPLPPGSKGDSHPFWLHKATPPVSHRCQKDPSRCQRDKAGRGKGALLGNKDAKRKGFECGCRSGRRYYMAYVYAGPRLYGPDGQPLVLDAYRYRRGEEVPTDTLLARQGYRAIVDKVLGPKRPPLRTFGGMHPNWHKKVRLADWRPTPMPPGVTEKPAYVGLPVILHREIPSDSLVKYAYLHRRNVGGIDRYYLRLELERKAWPIANLARTGSVTVQVGMRYDLDHDTVSVATWKGSDSRQGTIYLQAEENPDRRGPAEMPLLDRFELASDLQAARDIFFDQARMWLSDWMTEMWPERLPDWLREKTRDIDRWRKHKNLTDLIRHWQRNRFEGDESIFRWFDDGKRNGWLHEDARLHADYTLTYDRAANSRQYHYRQVLSELRQRYRTVKFVKVDWAKVQRSPDVSDERTQTGGRRDARLLRRYASCGMFQAMLPQMFAEHEEITPPPKEKDREPKAPPQPRAGRGEDPARRKVSTRWPRG